MAARLPLIGTIESGARDDFLAPVPVGDHGDGRVLHRDGRRGPSFEVEQETSRACRKLHHGKSST